MLVYHPALSTTDCLRIPPKAPNFAYALVVRKFNQSKSSTTLDLSALQHMINAAEPVECQAISSFYHTFRPHGLADDVVVPTYGLAEHTVFVCSGGRQVLQVTKRSLESGVIDVIERSTISSMCQAQSLTQPLFQSLPDTQLIAGCGYPSTHGVKVVIVDIVSEEKVVKDLVVGEIWVASPSKAMGYWRQPEQTKSDFYARLAESSREGAPAMKLDNGDGRGEGGDGGKAGKDTGEKAVEEGDKATEYLRTGDLGFFFNEELFVCGRLKDLIIIGGSNHYPQDIERSIEQACAEQLRAGCSAAFAIQSTGTQNEAVVFVAEVRTFITRCVLVSANHLHRAPLS